MAPIARSMPPVSMTSVCATATSATGNQFWVKRATPLTDRRPGNRTA